MEIKDALDDDLVIIQPVGRLDSTSSPEFEQFLLARISDQSQLIVDFSKLDYISSAGLRVILKGVKQANSAKAKILLCGMKDVIHQIFEISGFLEILKIEKNLSKAKNAIKR